MRSIGREEGLSDVVGFILILGLLTIAMSVYVVYEVPNKGREDEIQHMNGIKDRFVDYKISLDSLWINSVSYNNNAGLSNVQNQYSVYGVRLGTSFNLGSGGGSYSGQNTLMPFFTPIPSAGEMEVDETHGSVTISVEGVEEYSGNLGSLNYISDNKYWVNQQYYYQMGGVFLRQDSGITIRVDPLISIYNVSGETAVQITPVKINGSGIISGSGPVKVDTRLKQNPQTYDETQHIRNMEIILTCADSYESVMWERYIKRMLAGNSVSEGPGQVCDVENVGNIVTITVNGPFDTGQKDVYLDLYNADFSVSFQSVASGIT